MNIAIFTDGFYPQISGITTALLNHIKNLTDKGHKIIVFAPKDKNLKEEIKIKNVKVIRSPSISYPYYKEQKISFINVFRTVKILRRFNTDVVHIQTPGSIGIAGCLSAKIIKKPLMGTYHTLTSELVTYFSLLKPNPKKRFSKYSFFEHFLKVINKNKYQTRKNLIWNLTISLYNMCDLVLVPSFSMIQELKNHHIKPDVKYISNGLDLTKFKAKEDYNSKQIKILHVGRLSYEKNIDVILKVMKKIICMYPNVVLNIVGGGPAEKSLKKLANKLGIEQNVNFMGYVNRKNLPEIYSSNDIFVTASTMETQGLVILEAMASGLPIVGVKKYAIPDIVLHGRNGFLAEPGDSEKIVEYLYKLIEDKSLRENFGAESLLISAKHNLPNIILEMEKTYDTLVKNYMPNQSLKSFPYSLSH